MSRPDIFDFDRPWQEFRDKYSDAIKLTRCYLIGPKPDYNDSEAWRKLRFQQWELFRLKQSFETGDHLAGIEAYLFTTENLYHVPTWINFWFYAAFKVFSESKGKKRDLFKLLGMETRQRAGNPYSVKKLTDRDYRIAFEIEELRFLTHCGVDKCCEILSCHKDSTPEHMGRIKYPKPKTIKNIYEILKNSPEHIATLEYEQIETEWGYTVAARCLDLYHQAMIEAAKKPDYQFTEQDRLSIYEKNPFLLMPLPEPHK